MVSDYRNAVAGAFVTLVSWGALEFAGVEVPAFVGAAAVTLVVFGLGFIPKPSSPPPPSE